MIVDTSLFKKLGMVSNMKNICTWRSTYAAGIGLGLMCVGAFGDETTLMNYQGRLLDTNGAPINGVISVSIGIYTSSTAEASVYSESVGNVTVQNGLYSFTYGTNASAVRLALENLEAWIELQVNGSPLWPRQRLGRTPYALNVDEKTLVQSTQFLLDMIAKHEQEIQGLRAHLNLPDLPPASDYLVETFTARGGNHGLVDTNQTDAYYNTNLFAYVAPTLFVGIVPSTNMVTISASSSLVFSSLSQYISSFSHETMRTNSATFNLSYVFRYVNGTIGSNKVTSLTQTPSDWVSRTTTNPNPSLLVTQFVVLVSGSGPVYSRNSAFTAGEFTNDYGTLGLNIPPVFSSNKVTHFYLYGAIVNRNEEDSIEYAISDGGTVVSNLEFNTKYANTLTNYPAKLIIRMGRGPTHSISDTGLESILFKWWTE